MSRREQKARQHRQDSRALRQLRKATKQNRKPKRVRRKDWTAQDWDDPDHPDCATYERIMPPGEEERRERAWSSALRNAQSGAESEFADNTAGSHRGIVVEVSEGLCQVAFESEVLLCSLRGTLTADDAGFTNVVAVGDEVEVSKDGQDHGVIEAVMPRRSALVRRDVATNRRSQVVVANVDQLLIVSSWCDPLPWPELIDRYLITAAINHLVPLLCLNKVDLADDRAACRDVMEPYLRLGHAVCYSSAVTGEGIAQLREQLRGRATVLAGLSGVGKSSLLGAVQPGLRLRVASVSQRRHEGRHTTSQVCLVGLEHGGFVADTPGIREFGLAGLRRSELMWHYPEIAARATVCRFADCQHMQEPGCAVRSAVELGQIPESRYRSYRKIYRSLPA